jgi:DNA polymerase-3 subunit chi
MSEALFYHLETRTLEDVLPGLIERTMARGWRAVIRTESAERAGAIDALLWAYDEESFLPHAQLGEGDPAEQPVLIAVEETWANRPDVLFLVGGATLSSWEGNVADFRRIVLLFDGRDGHALSGARQAWADAKAAGHEVTYWKQSAGGKWEKQA